MERLTKEEHRARSMLLGLHYMPAAGYYFDGVPITFRTVRLDADTMEPLSYEQKLVRLHYMDTLKKSWLEMTDDERDACPIASDT